MAESIAVVVPIILSVYIVYGAQATDYCIVGAGPGGLQIGSLLAKANRDYVMFERGNSSGESVLTTAVLLY